LSTDQTTNTNRSGLKRYMAPELLDDEALDDKDFCRTPKTDVYSFASLCLEVRYQISLTLNLTLRHHQVFTGHAQFPKVLSETAVTRRILLGQRSPRPDPSECFSGCDMPDIWWEIVQNCLEMQPSDRPSMSRILDVLHIQGLKSKTRTSRRMTKLRSPKKGELLCPFQSVACAKCELFQVNARIGYRCLLPT
jgi:serine/threonine protein kinase